MAGRHQAHLALCGSRDARRLVEAHPDDAGFPAGLERTIVVDLTGKLPAGAHRIRLVTNLEIFWDQVLIDNSPEAAVAHSTEVPLAFATLHFRGYPKQIEGPSPGDLDYDYDRVSLTGPFQHQRGNYTRMGDVTPLLKGIDDRYAIFGSGEEIAAEFDATKAARAARPLEARLLLLRQRLRQRHGLVGRLALHRRAVALPQ
jgi:hypothetical protein